MWLLLAHYMLLVWFIPYIFISIGVMLVRGLYRRTHLKQECHTNHSCQVQIDAVMSEEKIFISLTDNNDGR